MCKVKLVWSIVCAVILFGCNVRPESYNCDEVIQSCVTKAKVVATKIEDEKHFPRTISSNQKQWKYTNSRNWTSGFWPGILWMSYQYTGEEQIRKEAERFTKPIEEMTLKPLHSHDIGFQTFNSFGLGYRMTGSAEYKNILLRAADSLATLYNPRVGTILSWPKARKKKNWPHHTIIDNMMNLELLFWASKNGGGQVLYDIATTHAKTTLLHHIRPDSTTYHVAFYNDSTGQFIKGITHQGYSDNSVWARGQAWGIYGFTMCYRETRKPEFLSTAKALIDAYLKRLPEDRIPFWDFDDPAIPNAPRDASAAAITASALIEFSTFVEDEKQSQQYLTEGKRMIKALSSEPYWSGETNEAFLLHSTGHKPKGGEVDVPIVYADYYFLEALLRLQEYEK